MVHSFSCTLNGDNPAAAECKGSYVDAGATAADACDGDLTGNLSTSSNVDTSKTGAYGVTYTVTDSSGPAPPEVAGYCQ